MPERSVVTRFEAKVDGYLRGVTQMAGATDKFAKTASASATKHKADWDKVGKAALVGGVAVGAVVVGAAKAYADFEKAMSGVAAVADANATQLKALGVAAREAGKNTVFSAMEAAQAEGELAKAGVSVSDIMGGALTGSLNLAAAGQIGLADAATISAQAMNIFNKNGSDVGHIADVLTAGANKSAAGVDDLGMALQQGGLVAKQTGLSLEDTVGVLSAFADNALKGSDAGTAMKTMFQRLNPQSDEAAALMDELGLRAYDAGGNFVGVTKYAGMLQTALQGMSAEQRNAALQTLFGSDAVRGANVLYEQGAVGIQKYIDQVNDQGAAQRMAARQTDNLVGDIEKLKGALQDAFIGGGEGGNAGIRSLVQNLTDLIDKFGELDPAMQANIVKGAALTAGVLLLGGGTIKAIAGVKAFSNSLDRMGISQEKQTAGAKGLAKAIAAVAAAALVSNLGDGQASVGVNKLTGSLIAGADATEVLSESWSAAAKRAQGFDSPIRSLGDALDVALNPSKLQQIDDAGGSMLAAFGGSNLSDIQFAKQRLSELDVTLTNLVSAGHKDDAERVFGQLARQAAEAGYSTEQFTGLLPQYQEALDGAAVSATAAAGSTIKISSAETAAAKSAEEATKATRAWADELDALNSPALDARAAARQFEQAIDDVTASIKENGRTLDIHTEKGRKNQASLDAVAKAAIDQVDALQANGASQGTMQRTLDVSRDRLIKTAEKFGMSKKAAKAYADQVLKTPEAVTTVATFRTVGVSDLQAAGAYLRNLHDKKVTLTVGTIRVGNTRVNAGQFGNATGGAIAGPGTGTSDSIPSLLSNGEHVLTASDVDKAGGQSAIYRLRGMIQKGALRFAGGGAVTKAGVPAFADGGDVDFARILAMANDITSWDDVTTARTTSGSRARAVTAAKNALASLVNQQKKAARDLAAAQRALRAADTSRERATARDRINDVLDRQRLLLGKVAAAEGKVTTARQASAAAAKATAAVEKDYRVDKTSLANRTLLASNANNKVSAQFLKNIQTLMTRGYGGLALQLLDMGGPDAETLAAQAVTFPGAAALLSKSFDQAQKLDKQMEDLRAKLTGDVTPAEAVAPKELGDLVMSASASLYKQVRDLSGVLRAPSPSSGAPIVFAPQFTIQAPLGDKVAIGAAVEDALVNYQNATGNNLRITTQAPR